MNCLYQAICCSVEVPWRLYKQYVAGSKPGQFEIIIFVLLFLCVCVGGGGGGYNEILQFSDLLF